ncbi:alpha-(1,3)-fucosyltransferase C [Drosophila elegans]|uniref:alpha-(1,3)-fucosyltransferase C n=1 Tax=Drosophila elegans TaxID=30023 RepID=UPI0007E71E10|nr:alpha-(1,3)-fucosyltransferase C [Drosophila elegans]XP_017119452.1 alpha-(1,3)-fucosyltransferase C [Drosophila elegans]XP_017119453.1 alpha-(1,3)-fucosyltransferase C [Drosophila elegans]
MSMAVRSGRLWACKQHGALVLLLLILAAILVILHRVLQSPLLNQYAILQDHLERRQSAPNTRSIRSTRTILLWSDFFGDPRWKLSWDTLGPQQLLDELHCPVYQCKLSNQHDFLPAVELYDAIVFHAAEMFPLLRPVPHQRSAHQVYVFALMEPPGETKHRLDDESGFYNLTMTYRLDSDVVWPYGQLLDIETDALVAPSVRPHWRRPPAAFNDSAIWNLWAGKTKMVAWFVSHCETLSKREILAKRLQEFVEVDIYGKCGTLSCERGDPRCESMLDTDYLFYLAFENSLCEDYVTEKLFNILHRNIIPVVFGGADYSRILPPHSYIDANRFETVADLARHLSYVAGNPKEYVGYFWWRRHYRLASSSPFCDLCARLHAPGFGHKTQVYGDIQSWWFNSCRMESQIGL